MEILRFLADQGVDLNESDNDNITPAQIAAINGHKEVQHFFAERAAKYKR